MGFREALAGFYSTTLTCDNCNLKTEVKIQKGKRVEEWIEAGKAKCENCGCAINKNKGGKNE